MCAGTSMPTASDIRMAALRLEAFLKDMEHQHRLKNFVLLSEEQLADIADAVDLLKKYDDEVWEREFKRGE